LSRPISETLPPTNWCSINSVDGIKDDTSSGLVLQTDQGDLCLNYFEGNIARLQMLRPRAERLPSDIVNVSGLGAATFRIQSHSYGWDINVTDDVVIKIYRSPFYIALSVNSVQQWSLEPNGIGFRADSVWCQFKMQPDSHVYGLGEKVGGLNKRLGRWTQWTTDRFLHTPNADPLYIAVPFAILHSNLGTVGIFLANAHRSYFDVGLTHPDVLTLGADGGDLDVFVITGTLPEILKHYTLLTGRMPMPPIWALGFQQSRYSYETEDEVRAMATKFRELQVPCDVIYLDIDYMNGYRVFTWDPARFPTPQKMISELNAQGVRIVPIVDPGVKVDPHYQVYQEGHQNGYFLRYKNGEEFYSQVWPGLCVFPDFLQPKVRQWWGSHLQDLVSQGISGVWNDMNEPAWNRGGPGHYGYDNDADLVHYDETGREYSHSSVHNLYAYYEAKATYTALKDSLRHNHHPETVGHMRPFILSRSGFAGIQQYAAVWTGDNCSWWEHLALSIPMCLNLGLSGVPWCGPDVGGFQHNATPELYARWIEMGVFFPFLRAHTGKNTHRHEPWSFGSEVLNIARQYIEYRYRLLPYWYSLFYQAHLNGTPPMRPLFWEYSADERTWDIGDQFLVGPFLMIAPILQASINERRVYVPKGQWLNVWTHELINGPTSQLVSAQLNQLPMFLKAGSIIPLGPKVQSTAFLPPQDLTAGTDGPREFLVVKGSSSEFIIYSDDALTDHYLRGAYRTILATTESDPHVTHVSWEVQHWPDGSSPSLTGLYLVKVIPYFQPPRTVVCNHQSLTQVSGPPQAGQWTWNAETHCVVVALPLTPQPEKPVHLDIEE
jgi:alpha-glucosidase